MFQLIILTSYILLGNFVYNNTINLPINQQNNKKPKYKEYLYPKHSAVKPIRHITCISLKYSSKCMDLRSKWFYPCSHPMVECCKIN